MGLRELNMINGLVGGPYLTGETFGQYLEQKHREKCGIKSGSKNYNNKNANIEYYTDEKGNIRKRRLK